MIKMNSTNNKKEMDEFLKRNKDITYSVKVAGRYDLILTVSVRDNKELKDFIYNFKSKFSDTILETNILPLFEIIYHAQLAEGFLE